jgi:hypothetical protein
LKWLGLALLLLLGVAIAVAEIQGARAAREAAKLTTLGGYRPPAGMLVCGDIWSAACAQEAADRIDVPVAWLPPPAGFSFMWLEASPVARGEVAKRIASEYLASDDVDLVLTTQPSGPWQPENERLVATYVENGTTVEAYQDLHGYGQDDPGAPTTLTLRWRHEGRQYELFVISHCLLERLILNPTDFAALVARVQYATPP